MRPSIPAMSNGEQRPITIAQAWSAPIIVCALGVGFALWGLRVRPDAAGTTAAIIILVAAPVTATALIARGIVGIYRRCYWAGCAAVAGGILIMLIVVAATTLLQSGDGAPQW